MRITVLAGGVGSARLLAGLVRVTDPAQVTVVVNTADDERIRGLHVSPDLDTVLYHLAGLADWERGWGLAGDTFVADQRYRELAARLQGSGQLEDLQGSGELVDLQAWFALGDRDLATHLLRTRLLEAGATLSQAAEALRRALGVPCRVLPMTDAPVRTLLQTPDGRTLSFQDYFVRRAHADPVCSVRFLGAEDAPPAPGVLEAIGEAEVVVIPPSNPILSVGPVLAVQGVREALRRGGGRRVAVSPIVGGRALKGPADRLLASLGHEVSPAGVARLYRGLVDVFLLDAQDEGLVGAVAAEGMRAVVADTIMRSAEDAARLAKVVLEAAR